MQVVIDIPDEYARALALESEDASRRFLEDRTAQAYRERKLSAYQVQCILELPTRMQVDSFLLHYGIYDYTTDMLENDLNRLESLRP